jgi:hypothetical protein
MLVHPVAHAREVVERLGSHVAALHVPLIDAPAGAIEELQPDVGAGADRFHRNANETRIPRGGTVALHFDRRFAQRAKRFPTALDRRRDLIGGGLGGRRSGDDRHHAVARRRRADR